MNLDYRRFGSELVLRIDRDEEIVEQLRLLCGRENIRLARVQALGAVNDITVGVFDPTEKVYHSNSFKDNFEIVSLTGTVDTMDGESYIHLHLSVGDMNGRVFGGHLNRAVVSATCECVLTVIDGTMDREFSNDVGLNLIKFESERTA